MWRRLLLGGLATAAVWLTATAVSAQPAEKPLACEPYRPSRFNAGQGCEAAELEPGVLKQINFVRGHPRDYAAQLRAAPTSPATREAIAYLESRQPAPALRFEPLLGASAANHAADQGDNNSFEHDGSDGSTAGERMRREGVWAGMLAEEMSAGETTAEEVVRQLIVDEGVPSRGHRKDLLDPFLRRAGVGCAPHPTYGVICVIDLASEAPSGQ